MTSRVPDAAPPPRRRRRGADGAVLHLAAVALIGLAACTPMHKQTAFYVPAYCCRADVRVEAAPGPAGDVTVTVFDDSHRAIPGALVSGTGPSGVTFQKSADTDGRAALHDIPAGQWTWRIQMLGYYGPAVTVTLEGGATEITARLRWMLPDL